NLTAMMVTPFLFVFAIFLYVKFRQGGKIYKPHYIVLGLLLGIILAAFYWLPALLEMKLTDVLSVVGGGSDYKDHFVCLPQLWSSPWGFGGSVRGCVDGLSFKIGKLHILFGLGSLLTLFTLFKKEKDKFQVSLLFIIFLVSSVFLTLEQSKFIWDLIPHMAFFQFPWRFLILVSFFLSFLGGSVFWFLENINFSKKFSGYFYWLICAAAVIAIIFLNNSLFAPQKIIDAKSDDYTNKTVLNWKVSKISDEYMPKGFFKPLRPIDVPRNIVETSKKNFKILSLNKKTQQISFIVDEGSETTIYINIAYFPGWHVFVDGKQVWFKYSGQGLILDLSKGKHEIYLKFIQTPVEKAGNVISIAGVIMLIAGIISHRKRIFYG
ncbi:MAG TPA: YfhO family protein, partial [Candidatus Saccharimonadales bacterium]|nr:YfhO family protein [Candidatus Saccharimonadales bacterium]